MIFTLGADVEYFAVDHTGVLRSLVGKIGGTKHEPIRPKAKPGVISEDNVAVEYAIDIAKSVEQFVDFNSNMKRYIRQLVSKQSLTLLEIPFGEFREEELQTPESRQAGCDPDFCAWDGGKMNIAPDLNETNYRSAGGHIHFGLEIAPQEVLQFVKICDLVFGLGTLSYENKDRKALYGKAGCFRRKPYGIEYRTLSNAWAGYPDNISYLFTQLEEMWKKNRDVTIRPEVQKAINDHNLDLANELRVRYGLR